MRYSRTIWMVRALTVLFTFHFSWLPSVASEQSPSALSTSFAQPKYERRDFSFKVVKTKNAEGLISQVYFRTFVGKKFVKEYTFELDSPVSEEMAETIGTYSEEDLNFDGYPDVSVYLGYYGGFATNTQQEALLWDQEQHDFVYPDGYAGNGEMMLNAEKKTLIHTGSEGPDQRVTSYYRWHGHRLQHYLDEVWAIESDDDDNVNFDNLLNYPLQRYDAKLDGKISVIIVFQKNEDNMVAGYIYYPKTKTPAPIMIAGRATQYNGKEIYNFSEFQPDGKVSGIISLEHSGDGRWDDKVEGTWTNPKTEKQMKITDVMFSRTCPKWFTKSLLTPEDPDNIGREHIY